ncbi:unnamed protein product [Toxocara canis]|uniref:Neuropeptide CCHamide-1 n=1 Tax=Toxocara canis TaxID=6265 RepID=A0A183V3Q8_TOXCA|nr:unnamed protein product [Toxocara canis]
MSGTIPLLIIITIFCSHVIQLSALSAKYAMGISPEEEVKNGDHIKPIDNRMWTIEALPIDRYGTDWNDRVLYQKMALKRASLNNYRSRRSSQFSSYVSRQRNFGAPRSMTEITNALLRALQRYGQSPEKLDQSQFSKDSRA